MGFVTFRKVRVGYDFYRLDIKRTFTNEAEGKKALHNYFNLMNRIRGKKYHDISFLIVLSNTDGRTADSFPERTGKRGRPRIVVKSRKEPVDWHLHIVATGEKVCSFMQKVMDRINKNQGAGTAIKKKCWNSYFVPYIWQQSSMKLKAGDFDFSLLKDKFYDEEKSEI